ncbi:MAG: EFR1 family ferrodoxin [bacterium]|nr:EFR1 family ferrodoxin [bacterium]
MARSIAILYFSGTGNTEALAEDFRNEFRKKKKKTELIRVEDLLSGKAVFRPKDHDLIGIGYPIHALSFPRIFVRFLRDLPRAQDKRTFIFKSPGDPFGNGGSTAYLRKKLNQKGYQVIYETTLVMPANVFFRYPDSMIKQLFLHAQKKIKQAVDEILHNTVRLQKNNLFLDIFTEFFNRGAHLACYLFGKEMRTTKACNLCLVCVKKCPTQNIRLEQKKIKFGRKCTLCVKCFCICPKNAVYYRGMKWAIVKPWYDLARIMKDRQIRPDHLTPRTRGYFRRFYKYLIKNQ